MAIALVAYIQKKAEIKPCLGKRPYEQSQLTLGCKSIMVAYSWQL